MRLFELTAASALAIAAALAPPAHASTELDQTTTCQLLAAARHIGGGAQHTFVTECVKSSTIAQNGMAGRQAACEELADTDHLVGAARRSFIADCKTFR